MGNFQNGTIQFWRQLVGLTDAHENYMIGRLRNRGLKHPSRLVEGLEVAMQELAVQLLPDGRVPTDDQRACWATLDRAVHRALKEVRPRATFALNIEFLADLAEGRKNAVDTEVADAARAHIDALEREVGRLPVAKRVLAKLKLACAFYPGWEWGEVSWEDDEVGYLLSLHPGRTLAEVSREFHVRVQAEPNRQHERVPSKVIAWLLKRASADAVDSAFYVINKRLNNAAPAGAAVVSKAVGLFRSTGTGHFHWQGGSTACRLRVARLGNARAA